MSVVYDKIELWIHRKKWRKQNKNNFTVAANKFFMDSVSIGSGTYGAIRVVNWNNHNRLEIGSYCSVAQNVVFILDADHYIHHISTFPFRNKVIDGSLEGVSKGNIIVEDDVWIGYGVTILSGVHIGQGAVIAAGAVVSKDVEPYSIVGGIPAKTIKKRFSDDIISFLMTLDYSRLTNELIRIHIDELYRDISGCSLSEIMTIFSWIPKKSNKKEKS